MTARKLAPFLVLVAIAVAAALVLAFRADGPSAAPARVPPASDASPAS